MNPNYNLEFRENKIKRQFKEVEGHYLDLNNLNTFNEKLQWLKLYYHDSLMTKCADKYLVREYVREKIGEKYLIPLIAVYDNASDIDFDKLPSQFVLKVNWGSGQNIICKDKSKLDIEDTINRLKEWMRLEANHYYSCFEWCYKYIEPKIICEKYIEQMDGNLIDYKMFCFDGNVAYIDVHVFRHTTNHSRCFYSVDWVRQDATIKFPLYKEDLERPKVLDELIEISNILSGPFPHVRVDFYIIEENIYFGEMTFYNGAGYDYFIPYEWDYKFGELLKLPSKKKIEYDSLYENNIFSSICMLEPLISEIKELNMSLNIKDKFIINKYEEINKLNKNIESLKEELYIIRSKPRLVNLFNISNNGEYLQLTLFGIKLTFKLTKNKIKKLSKLIPYRKLKDSFFNNFNPYYKDIEPEDYGNNEKYDLNKLISYNGIPSYYNVNNYKIYDLRIDCYSYINMIKLFNNDIHTTGNDPYLIYKNELQNIYGMQILFEYISCADMHQIFYKKECETFSEDRSIVYYVDDKIKECFIDLLVTPLLKIDYLRFDFGNFPNRSIKLKNIIFYYR